MCVQCASAATMMTGAAAAGTRAWLAAHRPVWLGPRLMGLVSVVILVAGLLAVAVVA